MKTKLMKLGLPIAVVTLVVIAVIIFGKIIKKISYQEEIFSI